jgi:hypothetical protein
MLCEGADVKPVPVELDSLRACAQVDVAYELEQFVLWTLYRPPGHPNKLVDLRLRQACFESAVLHLRNIADFLRNTRPVTRAFMSDLVADHYFDAGWATRPQPFLLYSETDVESDEGVRGNVNRHLAHVTTTRQQLRVSSAAFEWDEIDPTLVLQGFRRFVADLGRDHPDRVSWFDGAARNADQALRTVMARRASGHTQVPSVLEVGPDDVVISGPLEPDGIEKWMR